MWKQEAACSILLLSEDGFGTNTVEIGKWVDKLSKKACATTVGSARGSEVHDEMVQLLLLLPREGL